MPKLNIVADENILLLEEFFAPIANITQVDGRAIQPQQVQQADALVLRSTAQVTAELLAGSKVQFVGTCTIGIDHLDTNYMDANAIAWHNAPGCNAEGVVDYAISAMNHAWQVHGIDPRQTTIGVVGAGNVGGRLIKRLQAAGLKVICSDPPKQAAQQCSDLPYVSLSELLVTADIVSLHTPLTKTGEDATLNLIDANLIQQLRPGSVLISAGRGEVVEQLALLQRLQSQNDLFVYLDVWQQEPNVDPAITSYCQIVTPHIAGHSLEGKVRGTEMIYQSLCQHFALPITQTLAPLLPGAAAQELSVAGSSGVKMILNAAVNSVYNISQDRDRTLQALPKQAEKQVASEFDKLRKQYPVRREFSTLSVSGIQCVEDRKLLAGLGFQVS